MANDQIASVLTDLVETLEDGRKGFAGGAELLEEDGHAAIAALMHRFERQRAEFSGELRQLASTRGITIDESGSVGGKMHRGWMSLTDAVTGSDPHAVLAAAESGEDHAVNEYEQALGADLPDDVRSIVFRQAEDVRRVHDEVRSLRDTVAQ